MSALSLWLIVFNPYLTSEVLFVPECLSVHHVVIVLSWIGSYDHVCLRSIRSIGWQKKSLWPMYKPKNGEL